MSSMTPEEKAATIRKWVDWILAARSAKRPRPEQMEARAPALLRGRPNTQPGATQSEPLKAAYNPRPPALPGD